MATEWYYGRDGQHSGPVGFDRLVELARSEQLLPADLVWQEGMADWIPAHRVDGLIFPASSAASERNASSWLDSVLRHLGKRPDETIVGWLMKSKPGSRLAVSIIGTAAMLAIAAFFALAAFVFSSTRWTGRRGISRTSSLWKNSKASTESRSSRSHRPPKIHQPVE